MLLLLGRRVPLSFVNRFNSSSLSALSTPVFISSLLNKFKGTHSCFLVSTAVRNRGTMPERRPFVRLPTDVYPVNYGLCLKPDLIDFTFEGKLEALVEVRVYVHGWNCLNDRIPLCNQLVTSGYPIRYLLATSQALVSCMMALKDISLYTHKLTFYFHCNFHTGLWQQKINYVSMSQFHQLTIS